MVTLIKRMLVGYILICLFGALVLGGIYLYQAIQSSCAVIVEAPMK